MATRRRTTPRRRTTRRRTRKTPFVLSGRFLREGLALVLLFLAIISVIALFAPDAGAIVRPWHDVLSTLLGWGIAFAAPLLAGFAVMLWMKTMPAERWMAASGAALVALALLGMFHLAVGGGAEAVETGEGGGALGFAVSGLLSTAVGDVGAWIVLVLLAVVGLLLYFNMTIGDLIAGYLADRDERVAREAEASRRAAGRRPRAVPEPPGVASTEMEARPGLIDRMRDRLAGAHDADEEPPLIVRRERPATNGNGKPRPVAIPVAPDLDPELDGTTVPKPSIEELEHEEVAHLAEAAAGEVADAALETVERAWELPPLDLLADAPESSAAQLDLSAKGRRIRETLAHFGIGVKVARIQEGPVVTQYALDVDPGIKLSRIEGLADNLALALSARSIRIEAPIPGEPYVGIEIPNAAFDLVTLKEVLASRNFAEMSERSKLAFALGQDVAGQPFSADLSKMPHMLIAGATGSGKSVCVNAIIDSFLMNATPAEV
ncbi:MAG TPA: DNA translocase FtsK 4TM domain-containing protein, partial [Patescibacteria group bacterium]|nr:DNA translocase FtsK 4TM domain-containing protein [Patescibacteria group bacterium]